jgi:hypothetical protein
VPDIVARLAMSTTSTATMGASPGVFRVGSVLGRALGLLTRHFVLFVLVAAVMKIADLQPVLRFALPATLPAGRLSLSSAAVTFGVSVLLPLLLAPVTQPVLYHTAFQDMLGRPVRFSDSLGIALRRYFPVLFTSFAYSIAIGLGALLLLVPGIIIAIMWCVCIPACVVERLGSSESLRRSRYLTKGHRWRIFGIGLLVLVIALVVGVLQVPFVALLGLQLGLLAEFAVQAILTAFGSLVLVVTYHDLRVAREGVGTDRIAAVFD